MTKQITLLLLSAGLLFTGACKKINYHQLSDEDMTWLVYQNNEIDHFQNSQGDEASYLVILRTKSYYDNGNTANEFTTASFQELNDTTAASANDSKGQLYIYKQSDNTLLVTLSWPHFPIKTYPLTNLLPNSLTVNGILYNDVFILDGSGLTDSRNYVRIVWYSRSSGVVQYQDTSGELWERVD